MKLPVLLFDLDGTLIDSESFIIKAWEKAYRSVNAENEWDLEKLLNLMGQPSIKIAQGFNIPKKKQELFVKNFRASLPLDKMVLFDDVIPVLIELSKYDIPKAVITGAKTEFAQQLLIGNQINEYFPVIIGGDITKRGKPFPDPIFLALEKLNVNCDKTNIFFIGDSINDLLSAKAAGVKSVLIWRKKERVPKNLIQNAELIIHNLYELMNLIGFQR